MVSYLVATIHQTTNIEDRPCFQGKNLEEIIQFDWISPLIGPDDPPMDDTKIWKLLKMVEISHI